MFRREVGSGRLIEKGYKEGLAEVKTKVAYHWADEGVRCRNSPMKYEKVWNGTVRKCLMLNRYISLRRSTMKRVYQSAEQRTINSERMNDKNNNTTTTYAMSLGIFYNGKQWYKVRDIKWSSYRYRSLLFTTWEGETEFGNVECRNNYVRYWNAVTGPRRKLMIPCFLRKRKWVWF